MAEHTTRIALKRSFMLTLVVVAVLGSGCATSYMRSKDPRRYRPCTRDEASAFYPATMLNLALMDEARDGTRIDMYSLGTIDTHICTPFFLIGGLLDLPFSLLTDTLWLPADISRYRNMTTVEEGDSTP